MSRLEERLTQIPFGSTVTLYSPREQKYVSVDLNSGIFKCDGNHPMSYVKGGEEESGKIISLKIINPISREQKGNVQYNSPVAFMIRDEYFVTMRSSGELKLEKADSTQSKGINLQAMSKCIFVDPANPNSPSKDFITPMSKVAVKSTFGHYIKIEADGKVSLFGTAISEDSTFSVIKAHVPLLPDWLFKRPFLSKDPVLMVNRKTTTSIPSKRRAMLDDMPKTLGSVSIELQEQYLIQDLLNVLLGIDGTYIRRKDVIISSDAPFEIEPRLEHPTCDSSLLYLASKLIALGSCYERLQDYIRKRSHFEYGYVCHAVCGALQSILREYLLLLTQIDTLQTQGTLTLQKLWYFLQPTIRVFTSLTSLISEIATHRGGSLLSCLYRQAISTSEPNLRKMLLFILEKGLQLKS